MGTLCAVALMTPYITFYMTWASIAYLAMSYGFILRKNRKLHVPLMLFAIVADVSLVLLLEFQRQAINTAISFKLGPLQQAHIGFSTLAVVTYFPILYLGIRANWFTATPSQRNMHKKLGITAYLFRTIGFLLMFSMLNK